VQEQNAETNGDVELGIQRERAEASNGSGTFSESSEQLIDEMQADTAAREQAEAEQADAMQNEGGAFNPKLEATGVVEGNVEADAAASEEPVEVDFSTLSEEDARSVLFNGLVEMNARLVEVEQRLMLLAQSFVRILEAAGAAEEGAQPSIEVAQSVPKMATKIKPR
jgi:hypothetical protein